MKRQQLNKWLIVGSSPHPIAHQIVKVAKNRTKAEEEEAMVSRETKGISSGGRRGRRDSDLLRNEMAATSAHCRRKTMPHRLKSSLAGMTRERGRLWSKVTDHRRRKREAKERVGQRASDCDLAREKMRLG